MSYPFTAIDNTNSKINKTAHKHDHSARTCHMNNWETKSPINKSRIPRSNKLGLNENKQNLSLWGISQYNEHAVQPLSKVIWKGFYTNKIKAFLWELSYGTINTGNRFRRQLSLFPFIFILVCDVQNELRITLTLV